MSSRVRMICGAVILAVLFWRLGSGPFLDGLGRLSAGPVLTAVGIGLVTTVCCAWRWSLVARGLGLTVPLPWAVTAYYRSQFLNSTLPGGVVGDVHRGVAHGRDSGDLGLGLRAVGWERSAGQLVQLVLTVAVLVVLPSPVRSAVPVIFVVAATLVLLSTVVIVAFKGGRGRAGRAVRGALSDVRRGLLPRRVWPGVVAASVLMVLGHAATFVLAARTAGSTAPVPALVPLALLALMAMSLPTSIGGWGPREGVAAWAFSAAGLGAGLGVSTAVIYGVLALAATLPGAVVLAVMGIRRRATAAPGRSPAPRGPGDPGPGDSGPGDADPPAGRGGAGWLSVRTPCHRLRPYLDRELALLDGSR